MRRTIGVLALLVSVVTGPLGCGKGGGTAHDHGSGGHAHGAEAEPEVKTAQITVWMNGYEIFAEHTPPIAGRGTRFITHVSELQTGKPRSSGPIKFVFQQGSESFDHPQAAPETPGIYVPAITFPKEGEWQASVIIPTANQTNATVELGVVRVFPSEEA